MASNAMGDLNRGGIVFGAGAGLVVGVVLELIAGGTGAPTGVQVLIQLFAFLFAGFVAGRFSLVGVIPAGGFAALLLYFGLAIISIVAGNELHPVAILVFGILALALGSAGAALASAFRRP
jgi:hypothetical protein